MKRKHIYFQPKKRIQNTKNTTARHYDQGRKINFSDIKNFTEAFVVVFSIVWFLWFFLVSKNFEIKTITISGMQNIPEKEILEIINKSLEQKRFLFMPGDNIIIFDKNKAISDIGEKYILESISIQKNYPFEIKIVLQEKLTRMVLRAKTEIIKPEIENEPIENSEEVILEETTLVSHNIENGEAPSEEDKGLKKEYSEEYFFLDINGIVVSSVEYSKDDKIDFPIIEIIFNPDKKINPGDAILDREKIETIFAIYEATEASEENIKVSHIIYNPSVKNEFKFMTQEGWQGIIDTSINLKTQINKLDAVLRDKIKDKRNTLQFVDLRIKDRVYFK